MTDLIWIASQAFILCAGSIGLAVAFHHWTADHRAIIRIIKGMDK